MRGIDFTDDPLLQGRIFSYLDTQLNRHGGPNFEQIPINRPIAKVHNNNRDGAGQSYIHKNIAPYTPNTLNKGFPKQANQTDGRGFFTAPDRKVSGKFNRDRSKTLSDHWSQPRLFYNSLSKVEQQFVIDNIRFEMSVLKPEVQKNMLKQLNKISHDIAVRVGQAISLEAPPEDSKYYHNNKTKGISIFGQKLPSIATLRVGILASSDSQKSLSQAKAIKDALKDSKTMVTIVAEKLADGVGKTYSAIDATAFDAIVATDGTKSLFDGKKNSVFVPLGRPTQMITDGYNWAKPLVFLGDGKEAMKAAGISKGPGIYESKDAASAAKDIKDGLTMFKFVDRYPLDPEK